MDLGVSALSREKIAGGTSRYVARSVIPVTPDPIVKDQAKSSMVFAEVRINPRDFGRIPEEMTCGPSGTNRMD
jgi:hypothetical protein